MQELFSLTCSISIVMLVSCLNLVVANQGYSEISTVQVRGLREILAQKRSVIADDIDVIAAFSGLTSRWNNAVAPLVRDYLDPNVSSELWIKEASFHIGELRSIYIEMNALTFVLQDPDIRKFFKEIVTNYKAKLSGVTALHYAVAYGNETAQIEANQSISNAAAAGNRLAQTFLDRLRPYIDTKVLIYELQKRSQNIRELMKPSK